MDTIRPMAGLVLGPLLRYVGRTEATIWVETDGPCEVEVLGRSARTFCVEGHHYALVVIEGLEPGSSEEYEVALDGERAWPPPDSSFPPSVLRTFREREQIELVFGSCRLSLPHEPPYTLPKESDEENGRGFDALHALARSLLEADAPSYPDLLFLCGDQVYADQVSPRTLDFIRQRDDRPRGAPPDEVADFEEFTRLYREAWSDPVIRWLLSTVSSSMVIDDHDMHDDWNISRAWCEEMERLPWWHDRVVGGMMAYWLYQFIGNLSPHELAERPLWNRVQAADDAGPELRAYMAKDDQEREGKRWSFYRDLGTHAADRGGRAHRPLPRRGRAKDRRRRRVAMDRRALHREGDFDHLLFGSSDPWLLIPTFHNLEAWSEQVCAGRWGNLAARLAERLRQEARLRPLGGLPDVVQAARPARPRARRRRARRAAGDDRRALGRRPPRLPGRGRLSPRRRGAEHGLSGRVLARTATRSTPASGARSSSPARGPSPPSPAALPQPPASRTPASAGGSARALASTTRWPR